MATQTEVKGPDTQSVLSEDVSNNMTSACRERQKKTPKHQVQQGTRNSRRNKAKGKKRRGKSEKQRDKPDLEWLKEKPKGLHVVTAKTLWDTARKLGTFTRKRLQEKSGVGTGPAKKFLPFAARPSSFHSFAFMDTEQHSEGWPRPAGICLGMPRSAACALHSLGDTEGLGRRRRRARRTGVGALADGRPEPARGSVPRLGWHLVAGRAFSAARYFVTEEP
jgi:hypothetical protein